MSTLQQAIQEAIESSGELKKANKAYLEFIKANFIIPVDINSSDTDPEVLFLTENNASFLPVFTDKMHLDIWANEIQTNIKLLKLSGVDLLKGIGDNSYVCLDIGSQSYKEFNPSEIARMKSMVLKFFKNDTD